MATLHNHLSAPVVLVTKGKGREVFSDSASLMARLEQLPAVGDSIMTIQRADEALASEGVAALEAMLRTVGFVPFRRAALRCRKATGRPVSRFGTRWNWQFLQEYLGWHWRALR